jgi:predicted nuclease with TOPRIM domain
MSARVHQLLDEIREKSVKLKSQVAAERAKNEALSAENSELKSAMDGKTKEVGNLQNKVSELSANIESLKEQSVNSQSNTETTTQVGGVLTNEEIDALVKEIEYCIQQLKNKHGKVVIESSCCRSHVPIVCKRE